jgi:hypothetical protein
MNLYLSDIQKSFFFEDLFKAEPKAPGAPGVGGIGASAPKGPSAPSAPAAPGSPGAPGAGGAPKLQSGKSGAKQSVDCPLGKDECISAGGTGKHHPDSKKYQAHNQLAQTKGASAGAAPPKEDSKEEAEKPAVTPDSANIGSIGSDQAKPPPLPGKPLEVQDSELSEESPAEAPTEPKASSAEPSEESPAEAPIETKASRAARERAELVAKQEQEGVKPTLSEADPKVVADAAAASAEQQTKRKPTATFDPKAALDPSAAPASATPMDHYRLAETARATGSDDLAKQHEALARQKTAELTPEEHSNLASELRSKGFDKQARYHNEQTVISSKKRTEAAAAAEGEQAERWAQAPGFEDSAKPASPKEQAAQLEGKMQTAETAYQLSNVSQAKGNSEEASKWRQRGLEATKDFTPEQHKELAGKLRENPSDIGGHADYHDAQSTKTDKDVAGATAQAEMWHNLAASAERNGDAAGAEQAKTKADSYGKQLSQEEHDALKDKIAAAGNEAYASKMQVPGIGSSSSTAEAGEKPEMGEAGAEEETSPYAEQISAVHQAQKDRASKVLSEAKAKHQETAQKAKELKDRNAQKKAEYESDVENYKKQKESAVSDASAIEKPKKPVLEKDNQKETAKAVETAEAKHNEVKESNAKKQAEYESDLANYNKKKEAGEKGASKPQKPKLQDESKSAKNLEQAKAIHEKTSQKAKEIKENNDKKMAEHSAAMKEYEQQKSDTVKRVKKPQKPELEKEEKVPEGPELREPETESELLTHGNHTEKAKKNAERIESHLLNNPTLSEGDRDRLNRAHAISVFHSNIEHLPNAAHRAELSEVERTTKDLGIKESWEDQKSREDAQTQAAAVKQAEKEKATEAKASSKKQSLQERVAAAEEARKPKAPESDVDRAKVADHSGRAQKMRENIQSHLDNNPELSDAERNLAQSVLSASEQHAGMENVPTSEHSKELKELERMSGSMGKKKFEDKPDKPAPAARGSSRAGTASPLNYLASKMRQGWAQGSAMGSAAVSPTGAGRLGTQVIDYGLSGAAGLGHAMLQGASGGRKAATAGMPEETKQDGKAKQDATKKDPNLYVADTNEKQAEEQALDSTETPESAPEENTESAEPESTEQQPETKVIDLSEKKTAESAEEPAMANTPSPIGANRANRARQRPAGLTRYGSGPAQQPSAAVPASKKSLDLYVSDLFKSSEFADANNPALYIK